MLIHSKPTILWDFDRTLAQRPSERYILLQVLDDYLPGHTITAEHIRPFLKNKFPWNSPEQAHPELSTPGKWWDKVEGLFAEAYIGAGIDPQDARVFANLVHERYIKPEGFILYDDTVQALEELAAWGWQHVVLSNHMPELPAIVEGLGLGHLIGLCLTSANTGYEKPHPQAFFTALEATGYPPKIWMVGDNYKFDVCGAAAIGLPAILVHNDLPPDAPPGNYAATLLDAVKIINEAGI